MKKGFYIRVIVFDIAILLIVLSALTYAMQDIKTGDAVVIQIVPQEIISEKRTQDHAEAVTLVQEAEFIPYEDIPLDDETQIYMYEICREYHISYDFALAIMESESQFNADAVGDDGHSVGYYQIKDINWERMQTEYGLDPRIPLENIKCGIIIMTELFIENDDPYWVISTYKCGQARGRELYEQGIYETRTYSCSDICDRAREIEQTHENNH